MRFYFFISYFIFFLIDSMKKSSKKGKEMTQRSIISYVPKSKRGKHDVNDDLHSDDDSTDIIQENEEEYDSEIEIYEAQSSPEKKKQYIKDHYTYAGYKNNHSEYQCNAIKFENGFTYKCVYKERDSRLDFSHEHEWVKIDDVEVKTKEQSESITEYELLLRKIVILAGYYNLSFSVIESNQLWDLLNFVFVLGQKKNKTPADFIIKKPSHQVFRDMFIKSAKVYHESQLEAFSTLKSVSLTLDAGTLQYGHFLDFSISSPLFDLKPYLYDADFQCNNTSDCIKAKTESIIKELHELKVKVGTITGDNYPGQLYALSNWSKTALWRETDDKHVKRTIFFPCFCHFLQLVASDVENDQFITQSHEILNQMKDIVNKQLVKLVGKAPSEVETRWFSRFNTIKFLLNKKSELIQIRDDLLASDSLPEHLKEKIRKVLSGSNFDQIEKYTNIILPIYSATLFFDSNVSKASDIVPIVSQIKLYWEELKDNEDYYEHKELIQKLLERLIHRCFHIQDWPLLHFIYSLTPGGRIWARKMLEKYKYQLEDKDRYDSSTGLDPILSFKMHDIGFKYVVDNKASYENDLFSEKYESIRRENAFNGSHNDSERNDMIQPKSSQKNILFMFGESDPHFDFNEFRSIDSVKLLPFERKMDDSEFLYEPGHIALLEQCLNDLCDRFDYSDKKDDILKCYDFWIKSNVSQLRIPHYTKESCYKIWNNLAVFKGGWKYLSKIAIQLLSAQASETICERKISCQRYSITNRRQNSNEDLVEARFRLSCNEPPYDGFVKSLKYLANEQYKKFKEKAKEFHQTLIIESIDTIT